MTSPPPAWRTCLDVEAQSAGHYLDYVNRALLGVIEGTPRRVLELGCAGGMFGAVLKERYPGVEVTGVEPGRAAAAVAAGRLDHVVNARLEDVDWDAPPLAAGRFDLVVAADVLEHVVNPWQVLQRLAPLLAPGAQLVASIPNVRNIQLVHQLAVEGRWPYAERGLLDVTHLRFFTREEIRRMLEETGYRMEACACTILPALQAVHAANQGRGPTSIRIGRLTLDAVTPEELTDLCAEQFLVRARPA